ncbi:MAG: hypothetical protein EF813_11930 [Methanosarcinales archaeon]|nr:MAG: hypothetical protein EF813_11930 [Methanosarcinales archaeon]
MVTRGWDTKECIEHFMHDKTEAGAAKLFICLQDNREAMVWDDDLKRLRNMAEEWDNTWAPLMEEMTELLKIKDWDSYVQMKTKYNLTQY